MFLFTQIYIYYHNHLPTMDSTHSQIIPKPLRSKLSIPFTTLLYQNFHS